jgi:hypothetical protein
MPLVRICAGGGQQWPSLPRLNLGILFLTVAYYATTSVHLNDSLLRRSGWRALRQRVHRQRRKSFSGTKSAARRKTVINHEHIRHKPSGVSSGVALEYRTLPECSFRRRGAEIAPRTQRNPGGMTEVFSAFSAVLRASASKNPLHTKTTRPRQSPYRPRPNSTIFTVSKRISRSRPSEQFLM